MRSQVNNRTIFRFLILLAGFFTIAFISVQVQLSPDQYLIIELLALFYIMLIFVTWFFLPRFLTVKIARIHHEPIFIACPYCGHFQAKGKMECDHCHKEWQICWSCKQPFPPGSSVLITPCCGQGFHYQHFAEAYFKNDRCPNCGVQDQTIEIQ